VAEQSYETARLYETERDLTSLTKRATQMNLETHFHVAQRLNDVYFRFSTAPPEVVREATRTASEEHSLIYLDFLQKMIRLHEELSDRMIDASNRALEKSLAARKRASEPRNKRRSKESRKGRKTTGTTTTTKSEKSTR
jgi:hypothetical protein